MTHSTQYDCMIIGGGVAGSAAAYRLSHKKLRVLVIDRATDNPQPKVGECLSGQGIYLLKQTGLYEWALTSNPIENSGDLSSWGDDALIEKDFIFDKFGSGWHLDRIAFDKSIKSAAQTAGADYLNAHIRHLENNGKSGWKIYLPHKTVTADWLIDASGRHGLVSKYMGVKRMIDRPLIALYSWGDNHSSEGRTVIEATENGWWYTAKLPAERRITVFHTNPSNAQFLINNPLYFAKYLSKTRYLSQYSCFDNSSTKLRGVNASGSVLETSFGDNWLAVGDAAITFDPLSAHGILNALAHGVSGAQAIFHAMSGDHNHLKQLNQEVLEKRKNYIADIRNLYLSEQRWNNIFWRYK